VIYNPKKKNVIAGMKGGLIVSVQADEGSPLDNPAIISALAKSVAIPGCVGLRINKPRNIIAVRTAVSLPIVGIYKIYREDGRVLITPTFEIARMLVEAGADIVALDATDYPRSPSETIPELVGRIQSELGVPVMADISTFEEGLAAAGAGVEIVATTLSGYIRKPFASLYDPPDLDLVNRLSEVLPVPVIAEGRYNTPELACKAIQAGANAVVVGSAITRPGSIAEMYVHALASGVTSGDEPERTNAFI